MFVVRRRQYIFVILRLAPSIFTAINTSPTFGPAKIQSLRFCVIGDRRQILAPKCSPRREILKNTELSAMKCAM